MPTITEFQTALDNIIQSPTPFDHSEEYKMIGSGGLIPAVTPSSMAKIIQYDFFAIYDDSTAVPIFLSRILETRKKDAEEKVDEKILFNPQIREETYLQITEAPFIRDAKQKLSFFYQGGDRISAYDFFIPDNPFIRSQQNQITDVHGTPI